MDQGKCNCVNRPKTVGLWCKIVSQHFYVVKIILSAMTHFYVQDNSKVLSAEMSYHCFLILTCRRNSDNIVQSVRSTYIFDFSKKVVNILFLKEKPLSNERPGNFTFYWGIKKFSNSFIFEKITVFRILCCRLHFTEKSVRWQLKPKNRYLKNYDNTNFWLHRILNPHIFKRVTSDCALRNNFRRQTHLTPMIAMIPMIAKFDLRDDFRRQTHLTPMIVIRPMTRR